MGAVSCPHGEMTQARADAMRHLGREVEQGGHMASKDIPDLTSHSRKYESKDFLETLATFPSPRSKGYRGLQVRDA